MESNIGCDLNLEDSFRVKKLASLVDQKIANLLRNNAWRQKILTSPYSHEDDNDEDGDPYSHEDDDPSWGVVELAGRVDKAYLIFNMSNVCITTTTKVIEEKKAIIRTILTVCNIGANKGLSSLNSATSMACGIIVNGIIFSSLTPVTTWKCEARGLRCIEMSRASFIDATTFRNIDLRDCQILITTQ